MKEGNAAVNLSINRKLKTAVESFVAGNRRKGRRNISELTESLWIGYLRRQGVKLPAELAQKA